jgi:hypothetical protein
MLLVDNLMDLTHLGYLHAKTVGGASSRMRVGLAIQPSLIRAARSMAEGFCRASVKRRYV